MRILLIHQNFPGQFRSFSSYLYNKGHELVAICSHERSIDVNYRIIRYPAPVTLSDGSNLGQQIWHSALSRAESVAHICSVLDSEGWIPDCILAHSGWGETIALHLVWPSVPVILWPELWVHPIHGGHGMDSHLLPPNLDSYLDQIGRNSLTRIALDYATSWVMPTIHQALSLPDEFRDGRLNIIHEGIDTSIAQPNPEVEFTVRGIAINRSTPIVTFVNRNLERLRGFDHFMRSIPAIQSQYPSLRIFIVGDSNKGYGTIHPSGKPLRDVMIDELSPNLDLSRIHFLGRIPYEQYIALLQCSWVHVYLSYPFVLGWSLLEAMSIGCAIVGSDNMPVKEVLTNGYDGLLVPIDDHLSIANRVLTLLSNPLLRKQLGEHARSTAFSYDHSVTHPKILNLLYKVTNS